MLVPILIVSSKPGPISPLLGSLAMMQVVFPLTGVGGAIWLGDGSLAVDLVVGPLALADSPVN